MGPLLVHFAVMEGRSTPGQLVYRPDEYSFDFTGAGGRRPPGGRSLLVNDLQLEMAESGAVLYAWGLAPQTEWQARPLEVPKASSGGLLASPTRWPALGASVRVNWDRWPTYHDPDSGWICIGQHRSAGSAIVEYASGCMAVVDGDRLVAVWLKPADWEEKTERDSPALTAERYGNGYEISRPTDLTMDELRVWNTIRSELLVRVFEGRPVAVVERSWEGRPALAAEVTHTAPIRILGKGFWLTLLPRAAPDVLRKLGADSENYGAELWIIATTSAAVAEEVLRSVEESLGPDGIPPQSPCEAMSTVSDDHAVWWLHPERAEAEALGEVETLLSLVGWRLTTSSGR